MTSDVTFKDPADEREALIPWYVTGRLSAEERRAVEDYLAENPQARLQLDLAREELDETIAANEAIRAPSARMLDALMGEIEAREGPEVQRIGLMERTLTLITGFMPAQAGMGMRLAAIAAALVICVQAGAIGWMVINDFAPGGDYRTASHGDQATAQGPRALIGFAEQATGAEITALLTQGQFTLIDGPKPGGLYIVRLGPADMSEEDAARALQALRARSDIVRFAAPAR